METNADIGFFERLDNVQLLVDAMRQVTLAYVSNIVTQVNSICLKNLLVDNFIGKLPFHEKALVSKVRSQFKDWLAEQVSTKPSLKVNRSVTEKVIRTSNVTTIETETGEQLSRCNAGKQKRVGNNCYCYEIYLVSIPFGHIIFETAAAMFNDNFTCTFRKDCKIKKEDRLRRSKKSLTQLFTCSCGVSELKLQFRHNKDTTQTNIGNRNVLVTVLIKTSGVLSFTQHYKPSLSFSSNRSNNAISTW